MLKSGKVVDCFSFWEGVQVQVTYRFYDTHSLRETLLAFD
jgi:hypothetical protein